MTARYTADDFADRGAGRKAVRYVDEGRVTLVAEVTDVGTVHAFDVRGDTGLWRVALMGDVALCNCPSTRIDCSHVRAARVARARQGRPDDTPDDPFEGLDR